MTNYKDYRIIDGKPKWIIVDKTGKINRNPNKDKEVLDKVNQIWKKITERET